MYCAGALASLDHLELTGRSDEISTSPDGTGTVTCVRTGAGHVLDTLTSNANMRIELDKLLAIADRSLPIGGDVKVSHRMNIKLRHAIVSYRHQAPTSHQTSNAWCHG